MLEHGIYARLLDVYYSKEVGIEEGMVARLIGARSDDELAALRVVLVEFFVLKDGVYVQSRCDREIAHYQDKQRKATASANARWSNTSRNANALPTHTEGNAPNPNPNPNPNPKEEINLLTQVPARPLDEQPAEPKVSEVSKPSEPIGKGVPDCPHGEILELWALTLPALPQHLPDQWRGARSDHLRARWREAATSKKWTDKAQGLAYFSKLFRFVGQSDFLTGRAPPFHGKRPFVVELEWLVNPSNWAKVHEGKYHEEATA